MSKDAYIHKLLPGSPGGPLLFVFHGTGADENQLLSLGRDLAPQATIVSPRGDVFEQGAARFFRRTGEGVYDMDDLARATDKMAGFVKAHVEAAKPSIVLGLATAPPKRSDSLAAWRTRSCSWPTASKRLKRSRSSTCCGVATSW